MDPTCPKCGGHCPPDNCAVIFRPILDCEHQDREDGTCHNPENMTPECHANACPRLHPKLVAAFNAVHPPYLFRNETSSRYH